MKTINKQLENMGGVIRLWAIPKSAITFEGATPVILSDENVVSCYIIPETALSTQNQTTNFSGTTYKHEISGLVPGCNALTSAVINQMTRQLRYVVVYQNSDGLFVYLGTPEIPLTFNSNFTTGQNSSSLKNFKISFSGNCHFPPLLTSNSPFPS
jgi:hypothetical protein